MVNDANVWAIETMSNPRYTLEQFLRVITVSVETMKIVRSLPKLRIIEAEQSTCNSQRVREVEQAN